MAEKLIVQSKPRASQASTGLNSLFYFVLTHYPKLEDEMTRIRS